MPTVLITGANRGLGLEFARQYAEHGWRVLAGCRDPGNAPALRALRVEPFAMDVTDAASVAAAAEAGEAPIDLLINSAGIMGQLDDAPARVDFGMWRRTLEVNTLGPVRVLDAFAARIAASELKLAVTITSGMGSLADAGSGYAMMYRTSKAAVNMAMRARSFQLQAQGITVVVINPGFVRTDMGGPGATLSPAESVVAMRKVIGGLTPADSGRFINYTGRDFPW